MNNLYTKIPSIIHKNYFGFNMLFMGAGINYAIENKKYNNIPLIVIMPSIYTGYQIMKNRNEILKFFNNK